MRRVRRAVRALVLDSEDRVLLVRFDFGDRIVWGPPGGGLEPGESHEDALRRELQEELALDDVELGPWIWTRDDGLPSPDGVYDAQVERYYLVRVEPFDPSERFTPELYMTGVRWWTLDELDAADAVLAPRALARLVRDLLTDGPSTEPLDVGV